MRPRMSFLATACLAVAAAVAHAQQASVPLYGRFETQLTNDKVYTNPFKDVLLEATFTAPSGRKVAFVGFYDGDGKGSQDGNVWKLRFMPDEAGEWSFACRFSDGESGTEGRFVCVKDGARPGPLRVDGTRFVHPDKQTFQPRSYYYSEAFCGDPAAVNKGIETFFRAKRGFNSINYTIRPWSLRPLPQDGIDLPAGVTRQFRITVRVPEGARAGAHIGAIRVEGKGMREA